MPEKPGVTSESPSSERYSRQILFYGVGENGQHKLAQSSVAIVGCGATGSAAATLLARAGVGQLRIIDRDFVELSNLQRQGLFDEADASESLPKAIAAARKIQTLNSEIDVVPSVADLTPENISELVGDAGLILDGTDNFETRYLLNDFAVSQGKPWLYAAAVGSYCLTMTILPGETACLACMFPEVPQSTETCDTVGILSSTASLAASIQATEALKLLTGNRNSLRRTLLSWDVWSNRRAEVAADRPKDDCKVCIRREFQHLHGAARAQVTLCGRNAVQIHANNKSINFEQVGLRLLPHGAVKHNDFILKFWCDPYELTLFTDGRAIIRGTTDKSVARSFYARYIGA